MKASSPYWQFIVLYNDTVSLACVCELEDSLLNLAPCDRNAACSLLVVGKGFLPLLALRLYLSRHYGCKCGVSHASYADEADAAAA